MVSRRNAEAGEEVPKHGEETGFPLKGCRQGAVECNERRDADEGAAQIVELFPPERNELAGRINTQRRM